MEERQDDVIRMAREAGLLPDNSHPAPQSRHMADKEQRLKRFAALVIQHKALDQLTAAGQYEEGFNAGAAAEREACAKVCENAHWSLDDRQEYAAAIRARGQS